jgi:hypothetical protein
VQVRIADGPQHIATEEFGLDGPVLSVFGIKDELTLLSVAIAGGVITITASVMT